MSGELPIKMVSPDGRVVEWHWHPHQAGQMRLFYEKKGWSVFVEPEPPVSEDELPKKRGRKPVED